MKPNKINLHRITKSAAKELAQEICNKKFPQVKVFRASYEKSVRDVVLMILPKDLLTACQKYEGYIGCTTHISIQKASDNRAENGEPLYLWCALDFNVPISCKYLVVQEKYFKPCLQKYNELQKALSARDTWYKEILEKIYRLRTKKRISQYFYKYDDIIDEFYYKNNLLADFDV